MNIAMGTAIVQQYNSNHAIPDHVQDVMRVSIDLYMMQMGTGEMEHLSMNRINSSLDAEVARRKALEEDGT